MVFKSALEEEDYNYIPALLGVDQRPQEVLATTLEEEDHIPALLGCVD